MRIGIVGYQRSGKSTLFEWLTGAVADPALAHTTQTAMATVPDPRVQPLCHVYHPKKVSQAALELVDTPGLSRTHEGSATKLAMIREAGSLLVVIAAYGSGDPLADLRNFDDDLLLADLDIVNKRIERVSDQMRKPRPNRDELQKELHALEPLQTVLDAGRPLRDLELSPEQKRAIKAFQLFSDKPRLVILNLAEDQTEAAELLAAFPPDISAVAVSLSLQRELSRMEPGERDEFCREMGVAVYDHDGLLRQIMDVSGQMLFFTAGEKEVRTWMIRKGGTALDAAAGIHTDLRKASSAPKSCSARTWCDWAVGAKSKHTA